MNDSDSLEANIPKLGSFSKWLASNRDNLTVTETSAALSDIIASDGVDINYSQAKKEILWDSLYTQVILSDNIKGLFLLSNAIKTLNFIEKLTDVSLKLTDKMLGELYRSKVLIPDWMYDTLNKIIVNTDEGIGILPTDRPTKKERQEKRMKILKVISAARKAISGIRLLRERNYKEGDPDINSPMTLDEHETLPQDVKDTFGGMDGGSPSRPPLIPLDEIDKDMMDFATGTASDYNDDNQIKEVQIGNSIIQIDDLCADMTVEHDCGRGKTKPFPALELKNYASAIYVGDLLVTKQYLKKYDLGEVAHIEAVIKGLEKERTHRRLNRTETTTYFERETTNETERETQTTERFSMEKESQKVVSKDMQISTGVNISANYGMMNIESSTGFGYGTSQQSSTSEATSMSKEVTDRALTRVKERIKESELINIIKEVEETSVHSIKNAYDTAKHMNGVYRWVNKVYLNKILNYGQRRMMEYTIPEPANFYLFRKMIEPQSSSKTIMKPTHPKDYVLPTGGNIKSFKDITEDNYAQVVADYGVENITLPSTETHVIGTKMDVEIGTRHHVVKTDVQLKVPNGYRATDYRFMANWLANNDDYAMDVHIGYHSKVFRSSMDSSKTSDGYVINEWKPFLDGYYNSDNEIPISLKAWGRDGNGSHTALVTVNIKCMRTEESFTEWQMNTYNAIMNIYQEKLEEYEDWKEEMEDISTDLEIEGNNPEINRRIEREELKKRCIEMMSAQRFDSFDAATNGILNVSGYPEILFEEARNEGKFVKYFEQVYDWANMTYIFYPYFYGKKRNWLTITRIGDNDSLFSKFLQSGYARVVVPIKKGMEDYAGSFCGLAAWFFDEDPSDVVGVDEEWYISIAQELMEAEGISTETPKYVSSYEQKVPTNLVYIVPEGHVEGTPWPELPDNSNDEDIVEPHLWFLTDDE